MSQILGIDSFSDIIRAIDHCPSTGFFRAILWRMGRRFTNALDDRGIFKPLYIRSRDIFTESHFFLWRTGALSRSPFWRNKPPMESFRGIFNIHTLCNARIFSRVILFFYACKQPSMAFDAGHYRLMGRIAVYCLWYDLRRPIQHPCFWILANICRKPVTSPIHPHAIWLGIQRHKHRIFHKSVELAIAIYKQRNHACARDVSKLRDCRDASCFPG